MLERPSGTALSAGRAGSRISPQPRANITQMHAENSRILLAMQRPIGETNEEITVSEHGVQETDGTGAAGRRAMGERGFTLIELLVVMIIIGLLSAIALPAFLNQRTKAVDASAKELAHTAQVAAETYATQNDGTWTGMSPAALDGDREHDSDELDERSVPLVGDQCERQWVHGHGPRPQIERDLHDRAPVRVGHPHLHARVRPQRRLRRRDLVGGPRHRVARCRGMLCA